MIHGKKNNHLGRKVAHRKSMLANMACSLIEHKRINTTIAKAKALRIYLEPLITKSKVGSETDTEGKFVGKAMHNRRVVFSYLRNKYAVKELFGVIAEKIADRPGGYLRIIKLGNRLGDNAEMAMIEFVDYNDTYQTKGNTTKKKTRRRGGKKKARQSIEDAVENNEVQSTEKEPKDA